jgi:REP element-mobilizing transposase RayT
VAPIRIQIAGGLYHVTARGNDGIPTYGDDEDRTAFLEILGSVVAKCGWLCWAYCLMTNHYHAVIETPEANLGQGMQRLNGIYSQRFNRRHARSNHLFGRRYHSELIQRDAHLLEAARYVVLNPVRAGLCAGVADWAWSSFAATVGAASVPSFLSVDALLASFDQPGPRAQNRYARFVYEGIGLARPSWRRPER